MCPRPIASFFRLVPSLQSCPKSTFDVLLPFSSYHHLRRMLNRDSVPYVSISLRCITEAVRIQRPQEVKTVYYFWLSRVMEHSNCRAMERRKNNVLRSSKNLLAKEFLPIEQTSPLILMYSPHKEREPKT